MKLEGNLTKLNIKADDKGVAHYSIKLGEEELSLNDKLGQKFSLKFLEQINCVNCDRVIKNPTTMAHVTNALSHWLKMTLYLQTRNLSFSHGNLPSKHLGRRSLL